MPEESRESKVTREIAGEKNLIKDLTRKFHRSHGSERKRKRYLDRIKNAEARMAALVLSL
jgi:lysyl-tRNA synthetase class II